MATNDWTALESGSNVTAMPRVLNKYKDDVRGAVYIGRPSFWGNPYMLGKDGDRDEVLQKYKEYAANNPKLVKAAQSLLRGKDLYCFCAPKKCHGDVLLQIANETAPPHRSDNQERNEQEEKINGSRAKSSD